jgi:hypothetical protein
LLYIYLTDIYIYREHYQEPDNKPNADKIINKILLTSPGHGRRARQIVRAISHASETGEDNLTTPAKR